jgi:two-component system OmpR family response regulator
MAKVLVVEDDKILQEVLKYNLVKDKHSVIQAFDGQEALALARKEKPDLLILDIILPVINGLDVCRILSSETDVPIIMLTAKTEEIDKVLGLELGADDYISKPFSMRELMARVKARLRRLKTKHKHNPGYTETDGILKAGDLLVDIKQHVVSRDGEIIELGPKEFDLLVLMMANSGQVFGREQILQKVWGYDYIGSGRTVDVHIRWLRQKLERDPENPVYLVTVRGYGYKFAI